MPRALDGKLGRLGQLSQVRKPCGQNQSIPGEHGIHETRIDEGRAEPEQPHKKQRKKSFAECHPPTFVRSRRRRNFRGNEAALIAHFGTSTARKTSSST